MEKCPPAEACRDAFERMSKATVQMCMSTTGFGSDVSNGQSDPRSDAVSQVWPPSMMGDASDLNSTPRASQHQRRREQVKTRRPPPRFDMSLRDLFPTDGNHDSALQQFSRQQQTRNLNQPSQDAALPIQAQRPSPKYPFPPQQEAQTSTSPSINADQSAVDTVSGFTTEPQQQQQQYLPMQRNPPNQAILYNTGLYDIDLSNMPGLDFLQSTDFNQNMDGTGIDIGFGPGIDFHNNWSDGTGVDMFDGFFFGNAAG
jgi:hypothetical protein